MSPFTRLIHDTSSPRFFRIWFGYGILIFGLLAILAAWRRGAPTGLFALIVAILFWFESSTGYCRRCTHFNCGPHGAAMRRLFRRDPSPLPRGRLVLHAALDILLGVGGALLIVSEWPALVVPVIIWLSGAARSVLPRSPEARRDVAKWAAAGGANRAFGQD